MQNTLMKNRRKAEQLEAWIAKHILSKMHLAVKIVGGDHGDGSRPGEDRDAIGDGMEFEIKGCQERIRRRTGVGGTQPGRWKVDTLVHASIPPERAGRRMYVFVVSDVRGPRRVYMASHALVSSMLVPYARQGQYVSLSSGVWMPKMLCIWRRSSSRSNPAP